MKSILVNLAVIGMVGLFGCAEGAGVPSRGDVLEVSSSSDGSTDQGVTCPRGSCEVSSRSCASPFAFVECVADGFGCGVLSAPIACGLIEVCEGGACIEPQAGCENEPCTVGASGCTTEGLFESCVADGDGCGSWADPVACSDGLCVNEGCASCEDGDNDLHGVGCAAGADCLDSDPTVYFGADELCDGKDNDCDIDEDEGFDTVGQACGRGEGECRTTGTHICDPADPTKTLCTAPAAGAAGVEICDGKDNSCDGTPDGGSVCTTCLDDDAEENDSSLNGTDLTSARSYEDRVLCGQATAGDVDWYDLGTWSSGFRANIEVTQLTGLNGIGEGYANLDIDFYCGGGWCEAATGAQATTVVSYPTVSCSGCGAGDRVVMRVYIQPSSSGPRSGTPYRVERK